MRSRNIKPGFYKNEFLAQVSPHARLLFAGLWLLADREGRLEDRPLRIKAEIFPFEAVEVEPLLEELANSPDRFIARYEVNGKQFIQIGNFVRHQNPHKKEAESLILPQKSEKPSNYRASTGNSGSSPVKDRTSPADSLLLIPDSLTPEDDACASACVGDDELAKETFARFWEAYPNRRKVDRQGCFTRWKSRRLHEQADAILAALERWKASPDWKKDGGQYVCAPMVWLNQSRWESPPGQAASQAEPLDTSARDTLMAFPFIRHRLTGEVFSASDMSAKPGDAGNLYWQGYQPFPVGLLEGVHDTEGTDNGG